MSCPQSADEGCRHIQANKTYYVDLEYMLASGVTVSSATLASTDSTMTLSAATVLASDTSVPWKLDNGEVVYKTIKANQGISFTINAGLVGKATITVVATLSNSDIDAVGCTVLTGGEAA